MRQILHTKRSILAKLFLTLCLIGSFSTGCASYNVQTQKISQNYELGNIQAAASQISAEAEKRREGKDAVVWRLEQGAVLRAAGKLEDSNKAFDKAEELVNKYEEAAKMSVSREAIAAVTNLTTLPYEGFAYDKIMMNTYKALNYLESGDFDKARVEFNRAYERQRDAVDVNKARIEKAQDEGKKQNVEVDLNKINNDARFQSQFANIYGHLDQYKAYADYVNPLAVYLDAIFFMTQGTGNSDFEHSRNSFERVVGMIGENKFIQQDLETLQNIINGQQIPATTYVFFETGQAPERDQIRIDLPLFLITPGVPYVGAAFPRLKFKDNYVSVLNVSHGGTTEPTILLSNMDHVIAREFKNELPIVITKTLIASAIKAGATYGAYTGVTQGGRKNTGGGLAVLIAGTIYQAVMNQADLRTWTTLPKEIQFCRFPSPADRKIELEAPYSGYKIPVTIHSGLVNIVWVKSINRGSPLLVSQLKLKDEPKGIVTSSPPSPETVAPKEAPQQEASKDEQSTQMQQSKPSMVEQTTQVSQQESLKPEEANQGNKPNTSTEQQTQPSQPGSSKSEQSIQETQQETSVSEQSTQETKKDIPNK